MDNKVEETNMLFASGDGTAENPFVILDKEGLKGISNYLSAHYKLGADIDLGGETFTPIGTSTEAFGGSLDGGGYAVRNLKVSSGSYAGLFGYASGASFRNVRIEGAEIESTGSYAGILVGYIRIGNIARCGVEGSVSGSDYVGGLAGYAYNSTVISDSYAIGKAELQSQNSSVGGLVGASSAYYARYKVSISKCYAVVDTGGKGRGLVCVISNTDVEDSYYDAQVSGETVSDVYNKGKLTLAFTCREFFKGWDFENVWAIEEGESYPYLRGEGAEGKKADTGEILGGAGTEEMPYLIGTVGGLQSILYERSGIYCLSGDVDLGGEEFTPIGTSSQPFTGSFDGGGYAVRNLKVSSEGYAGLFGCANGASFSNVRIEGAEIESAGNYAGILVGYMTEGSITCCGVEGRVSGSDYAGGLAGYVSNKTIVSDSYAIGKAELTQSQSSSIGGLIGRSRGNSSSQKVVISRCYAAVDTGGKGRGLVYVESSTDVEDSYYDAQVSGEKVSDVYNKGKLTSAFTCREFFKEWDFENVWNIVEGESYPYLRGEGAEGRKADTGEILGGAGTEEIPYLIGSAGGFQSILYERSGVYRLSGDVNLGGEEFTPVGTSSQPFIGTFDGGGYAVRNLKVSSEGYAGLFGCADGASFSNVRIEGAEIESTGNYAGILVGYMIGGSITRCGVEGRVSGLNCVGGLAGYVFNKTIVSDSYAIGKAELQSQNSSVGGLVGASTAYNSGYKVFISRCYAAVNTGGKGRGLVYVISNTDVENSYYDAQVSGETASDDFNKGKLTSAFTCREFFKGWDFENVWAIEEGETYPYLRGEGAEGKKADTGGILGGAGTEEMPYLIGTAGGFQSILYERSGAYRLSGDVDLGGEAFTPIGTSSQPFTGSFDGGGHVVRNLKVSSEGYAGLFGCSNGASFSNVSIKGAEIESTRSYAGILAGSMAGGSITRCEVEGSVSGSDCVGILVGYLLGGNITRCGVEGRVSGSDYVGGLAGYVYNKTIVSDSYAIGKAELTQSQSSSIGGLIGRSRVNSSSQKVVISRCYAAVDTGGKGRGLVYVESSTDVEDSYYDAQVSGEKVSDVYNKGKLTSAFTCRGFFKGWDFESVWAIEEGESYPYLRGEGAEGKKADTGGILGGAGTEEIPYLIGSAGGFRSILYERSGVYRLSGDVDLGGEAFTSIGTSLQPFTGTFDGGGHVVRNLKVSSGGYAGLFGCANGASFRDVRIEGAEIESTGNYVGILTGCMTGGSITRCGAEGSVSGADYVGGLVGYAYRGTTISDSYAIGSVRLIQSSGSYAGGLVGYGEGNRSDSYVTVKNSYAAVDMKGKGRGLIYGTSFFRAEDCWYDIQRAGTGIWDSYAKGKLTSAFTCREFFKGWDFENVWNIVEGESYPYLRGEGAEGRKADTGEILGGAGTEEIPYLIGTAGGFQSILYERSGVYRLSGDVNLGGETFTPVGTSAGTAFTGTFDGGGHVIRNLKVSAGSNAGLFGYTSGATFRDVRIEGAEIESTGNNAGILVGCMTGGSITRCGVEGSVAGPDYVGGLAGYVYNSTTVSDSYAIGSVRLTLSSGSYAGGLVGYGKGDKSDSYVIVRNSYAAVDMGGKGKGLIYGISYARAENSWYDIQRAGAGIGNSYAGGKLTSAFTCRGFFKGWDFENVWAVEEGESYPYLKGEGAEGKKADTGEILGGAGTEEIPYLIGSTGGFQSILYERSGVYRLSGDVDLGGEEFTPIGTSRAAFTGTFDGGGHVVRNLKVFAGDYAGLFGCADGATFRNLRIEKAQVESTGNYAGILAGYLTDGTILGCYASGAVTGNSYVGGFAGQMTGSNAKLQESCMDGTITGSSYVGGLIGQLSGSIIDCYMQGSVTSASNSNYTGGLTGYSQSAAIKNSYASAQVSSKGQGLAYVYSSTTIQNSYFDSDIAEKTTPDGQARTTEQMHSKDTYEGWDMESIWEYQEGSYPILRKIEFFKHQLFELQVYNRTWHSAIVRWEAISNVAEYEIYFENEMKKLTETEIFIEDLSLDTDYELKVMAKLDNTTYVVSKVLKLKTRKISGVKGLHCKDKGENTITLTWVPIEDARSCEVVCNETIMLTDTNTCTLTELNADVPYVIYVRALLMDGGELISSPIVEKIFELIPQTDYAKEFIAKCQGQTWFIDEVENLLNQKGKSICTVKSRNDFAAIYALELSDRGISGQIPSAIGELFQLRYLYLANNDLSGQIPEEITSLAYLTDQDLSGNHFAV